ncbi:MAG: hypothetical protein FRX49_01417 [Trebouxia sp. A1-2]|nr:MAG: hypothetical protein FRX49_01417 [Trebouxia sp. A1-2]
MLTCKEALSSGLFIACGAIQLTAEEEALNGFGLQRRMALGQGQRMNREHKYLEECARRANCSLSGNPVEKPWTYSSGVVRPSGSRKTCSVIHTVTLDAFSTRF